MIMIPNTATVEPYYIDTPESTRSSKDTTYKVLMKLKNKKKITTDMIYSGEIDEIKKRLDILSSHILSLMD